MELVRAATVRRLVVAVPPGTLLRAVLRDLGQPAEGSAALVDDQPVPLDMPIERPVRFVVVSTFSGG